MRTAGAAHPGERDPRASSRGRSLVRDVRYDRLDSVTRGDLVTVALQGDQGKPRPALVVQADHFGHLASVTVLPITSTLVDAPLLRVPIEPGEENGLARRSQIMVDKPQTPSRNRLGPVIGRLDDATMVTVNRALAVFLGLA
jgi:mRNA interferase MazF